MLLSSLDHLGLLRFRSKTSPRERNFDVDLESGRWTIHEVGSTNHELGTKLENTCLTIVYSGLMSDDISKGSEVSPENVKLLIDKKLEEKEALDVAEKKTEKENRKKTSSKKAPKPPRPPRGPSLDAADQKLIKEISELAMLKRARIERMKALKKMKATKASSSIGNLFAMLFTVLFCLVIIFQGFSSQKSSTVSSFQGSPELAQASEQGFISVRYNLNPSAFDIAMPSFVSPSLLESVSGLDPENKVTM